MARKPKISVEECCKEFYDKHIFHAIVAGIDGWDVMLRSDLEFVTEADTSFSAIDPVLFRQEMTAVRMEVFALAFARKVKREDLMLVQGAFTRRYLEESGKLDIWDIMGEYNQVIHLSAVTDTDGQQMNNRYVTKINLMRVSMLRQYSKPLLRNIAQGKKVSPDDWAAAGRMVMRVGADMKREDRIAPRLLALKLADRLGCRSDLKEEALVRLWVIILGFYEGA